MKNQVRNLAIACLFLSPHLAYAGQEVGNGGDLVFCKENTDNQLSGYYSLDYLLTLRRDNSDVVPAKTLEESLDRIQKGLEQSLPGMLGSFHEFVSYIESQSLIGPRIWEEAPFELIAVSDEEIGSASLLPKNCRNENTIELVQAVIRQTPPLTGNKESVVYKYIPSIFDEIKDSRPLQVSFLLIHEWLWDFSDNVDRNRRINRYLHSNAFASDSPERVTQVLRALGIDVPDLTLENVPEYFAFDPRVCPVDIPGSRELIDGLKTLDDRSLIGNWEIFSRVRTCDLGTCSPAWSYTSDESRNYFGPDREARSSAEDEHRYIFLGSNDLSLNDSNWANMNLHVIETIHGEVGYASIRFLRPMDYSFGSYYLPWIEQDAIYTPFFPERFHPALVGRIFVNLYGPANKECFWVGTDVQIPISVSQDGKTMTEWTHEQTVVFGKFDSFY